MAKCIVALWSVPVYVKGWAHLSTAVKRYHVRFALSRVAMVRSQQGLASQDENDITAFFVAPEYLFAFPDGGDKSFHLDHEERVRFKDHFKNHKFFGTVVIPGTIASRKALTPEKKKSHLEHYQQYGTMLTKKQTYNYTDENVKDQKTELQKAYDRLRHAKSDGKTYYARNTAYAFFNGETVLRYHKRTAVSDQIDDHNVFLVGTAPGTRSHRGVTFGLEVCRDASQGYLAQTTDVSVDVQIVLSATVSRAEIKMTADKYLIHACNMPEHSGVWTKVGPVKRLLQEKVNGYPLDFYLIDIPWT
ncbi:Hypothetical protein A7982_07813 [Minicystis rosea]|nr:Hypothetical protein A7982_07813 [Minicystis rosea]